MYYVCLKFEQNVKTRPICSRFNFKFHLSLYNVHTTRTLGISLCGWDKNVPVHSIEPKNLRLRIRDSSLQWKSSNNWTFSLHFLKLRTNSCFGTKTKLLLTNPLPKNGYMESCNTIFDWLRQVKHCIVHQLSIKTWSSETQFIRVQNGMNIREIVLYLTIWDDLCLVSIAKTLCTYCECLKSSSKTIISKMYVIKCSSIGHC